MKTSDNIYFPGFSRASYLKRILGFMLCLCSASACTFEQVEAPIDCSLLQEITLLNTTPSSCGGASGSIEVAAKLANDFDGMILYSINGGEEKADARFENLLAGTYEIQASLEGACSQSLTVLIENSDGLNISVATLPSVCGNASGQISITPNDAVGTVKYSLNGNAAQTQPIFTNLSPGIYALKVTDDTNCEVSQELKVNSTVKTEEVQAIISTNCALSNCHGGNISPKLSSTSTIEQFAKRIGQRTGNKSMPPPSSGLSLSDADIQTIACWVFDNN